MWGMMGTLVSLDAGVLPILQTRFVTYNPEGLVVGLREVPEFSNQALGFGNPVSLDSLMVDCTTKGLGVLFPYLL